jgi:hypothetical protein
MKLQQLSVFLENRPGRLSAPCDVLAEKGIDILTLSLADSEQFGIMRLIVADWQRAKKALEFNGWLVNLTEVLAVEVDDEPGGLAKILGVVEQADLNIEYMYAFTKRLHDRPVMVFRFADPSAAIEVMSNAGISILKDLQACAG